MVITLTLVEDTYTLKKRDKKFLSRNDSFDLEAGQRIEIGFEDFFLA